MINKLFKALYVLYFIILFFIITCKLQDVQVSLNPDNYAFTFVHPVVADVFKNRELGYWNYNLKPFEAYAYWFSLGIDDGLILNLLGNTVAFMPMGFFEMTLSKHRKFWKVVLKCFIIVTCLELFQFVSCLGYLDIDDITMNTFGCLLGCLGYYLLVFIRQKAKNFFTKI